MDCPSEACRTDSTPRDQTAPAAPIAWRPPAGISLAIHPQAGSEKPPPPGPPAAGSEAAAGGPGGGGGKVSEDLPGSSSAERHPAADAQNEPKPQPARRPRSGTVKTRQPTPPWPASRPGAAAASGPGGRRRTCERGLLPRIREISPTSRTHPGSEKTETMTRKKTPTL